MKLAERVAGMVQHPDAVLRRVAEGLEGLGEVAWGFADPAPDVPLNVPIGSHRRYLWVRGELKTYKRIKDALGGTINDVVLTVVAGALRELAGPARDPHRGAGAARAGAGLDPQPRTSAAISATGSPRCARRCRSTSPTR